MNKKISFLAAGVALAMAACSPGVPTAPTAAPKPADPAKPAAPAQQAPAPAPASAGQPADPQKHLVLVGPSRIDGLGAFADGGPDPLDRAGPHVADREHALAAGLQQRMAGREVGERHVDLLVEVEGHARSYAIADEDLDRENDEKTSSVHFVRFEFTPAMRDAIRAGARGRRPRQALARSAGNARMA